MPYLSGQVTYPILQSHVRGKWVCDDCKTLIRTAVPAQVIDKGIPTAGLLAHVMISKFSDHLPLYRQETIFGRVGLAMPRSTLAQWVGVTGVQLQPLGDALRDVVLGQQVIHADEASVQMLVPGSKKAHRSYVWAYATSQCSDVAAVVYDFSPSRAGEQARNVLENWKGKLDCDDFGGDKASFERGVTEIGCMAHGGVSSSNCTLRIKGCALSKPCAISRCCTKSRAKTATWSRMYGAEYGKKRPLR